MFQRFSALIIFTQPYRFPTISGLYEMCAAGGESKLYRLRFPLDPYEVVWGRSKSFIIYYLTFSFIYDTFMGYPILPIPQPMVGSYSLNRNQSFICKDKLPFCNTGKFRLLAFLSEVGILPVLFYRHMKHLACRSTVNIAALIKDLQPPGFAGQKRKHTGFDGGEVGNDEFVPVPRHKRRADEFRQDFRYGVIQCREQGVIPGTDKASRILQMCHVVLRQVL